MSDEFKLYVIVSEADEPLNQRSPAADGQFTGHSLKKLFRQNKEIDPNLLQQSWQNTNQVVINMIKDAEDKEADTKMRLNEIEVTLSVSGEGTVGFVSGKAEAGIVLKFTRGG
ncbi:hypothetical protein [Pseudooceanicola marinus]|uniref:Pepco domain-containing protein n=1 Tax=Pseudooceanicola marinus TaxID=396013 RepID=UPI001CD68DF4|nr:hypothetical protein [Pseudooceanicola marinus]MCA1336885.1 hypothetical protein [Pseudooceanicola marinus]